MSKTESKTTKKATWSQRQDTMSWVGTKIKRVDSKEFSIDLISPDNSAKRQEYLDTFSLWVETCIRQDHGFTTSDSKSAQGMASFDRLNVLRVNHGENHANTTLNNQNRRKTALFSSDKAPRITKAKWREFLSHRPIKHTQRIVEGVALVTILGGTEIELGLASEWITDQDMSSEKVEVSTRVEMMKADIAFYLSEQGESKEETRQAIEEFEESTKETPKGKKVTVNKSEKTVKA